MTVLAVLAALVVPQQAPAPVTGPEGCRTDACRHRVEKKRRVHERYRFCQTWACVRRADRRAARRERERWVRAERALDPGTRAMLARLRGCETRGIPFPANYRYDGAHDGAYQYDVPTWHEAGGAGAAWMASPAEQDVRTARFYPGHRGRWACSA